MTLPNLDSQSINLRQSVERLAEGELGLTAHPAAARFAGAKECPRRAADDRPAA